MPNKTFMTALLGLPDRTSNADVSLRGVISLASFTRLKICDWSILLSSGLSENATQILVLVTFVTTPIPEMETRFLTDQV